MKKFLLSALAICFLAGCSAGAPPTTLSLEEIPAALQKAFKGAKEDQRLLTEAIARQIERKQFAPVSYQLQGMLEDRSLSKEQSALLARVLVTVNSLVQKQIEVQEAAVQPVAASGGGPRQPAPELPKGVPADEEGAAAAKVMRDLYRRTK